MADFDVDQAIAETNRCLPRAQQIHPDDPIVTSIILHRHILSVQLECAQKKLEESLRQIAAFSDARCDRVETLTAKVVAQAGNCIERQVDSAAQQAEERLRKAGSEGEASIRRASWLAWTGAILIFISACVMVGSYMGNFAFNLAHHAKDRHR